MDFGKMTNILTQGKQLKRAIWPNDGTHIALKDEKLVIWKSDDKLYHPLIVSLGDLTGTDWEVFRSVEVPSA